MKTILLFIIFFSICVAALGPFTASVAAKNEADIADIYLNREKKNIEVSFRIQNCFTPKMEEAILSGVETTFRILLVMEKKGFLFFRPKLLDIVLEHTIKYDRLNNQFHVMLPEHPDKMLTTTDFSEAKKWMSSVVDLPLIPAWRLERETEYKLRLKAELSKVHLPLFFRYIFYFVSLWDFETGWRAITFNI
jgi:hypothetical protein